VRGYLETGNKKRKSPAADAGASVDAGGLQRTVGTLCADTHPGAYSAQDAYTGRLIPAPVSHWDGSDVHPTLNQSSKGSGGVESSNQELFSQGGAYLVPGEVTPIQDGREMEKNQNGMGVGNPGDPAYTIDTTGAQAAAIPFRKSKRACTTTGNERVEAEALAVTTSAPLHFDTYNQTTSNISFTLSCSASDANHTGTVFVPNMAVRRLSPIETERLQGFPDNWSRISWKGKPEEQCPDGPRYKACGNSMAVPVMRWIGERIAAVDATISSNA
jgi:DNA (cytosine-5)-methyltransferase 1